MLLLVFDGRIEGCRWPVCDLMQLSFKSGSRVETRFQFFSQTLYHRKQLESVIIHWKATIRQLKYLKNETHL